MRIDNKCIAGHEMTPENTRVTATGHTACRLCQREHWRNYYYRKHYGLKKPPPRRKASDQGQSVKDKR